MAGLGSFRGKVSKNLGGFTGFIFSNETVAVFSAVVISPVVSRHLLPLIQKIPVLNSNITVSLAVAALVVFVVAKFFMGYIRSILLGVAAAFVLNAFQQSSVGQNLLARASLGQRSG